jgi:integrase-like protein
MMEPSPLVSFPQTEASQWISAYHQARLLQKDEATVDAYLRILRQFTAWVIARPGHSKQFRPEQLTRTIVEVYLSTLQEQGYSVSHRTRVKAVIKQFCQWLIDEHCDPNHPALHTSQPSAGEGKAETAEGIGRTFRKERLGKGKSHAGSNRSPDRLPHRHWSHRRTHCPPLAP